jgi:hypothetical protein
MYGPTAEPPSSHAFITEHPKVSYEAGRFNKVPLVMSVLEKEGLLIHAAGKTKTLLLAAIHI